MTLDSKVDWFQIRVVVALRERKERKGRGIAVMPD
jgi:hypothetical protein